MEKTISEDEFQNKLYFELCQKELKYPDMITFAVPNGGKRDEITAVRMKNTGTRKGVSDLICIGNGRTITIECKKRNGTQSNDQKIFERKMIMNKIPYLIVKHGINSVSDIVNEVVRLLYS